MLWVQGSVSSPAQSACDRQQFSSGVFEQIPLVVSQTSCVHLLSSLQSPFVRQQPGTEFCTQNPVAGLQALAVQTSPSSICVQLTQEIPSSPHCESFGGVMHVAPEQHPSGQDCASHMATHAPPAQICPGGQETGMLMHVPAVAPGSKKHWSTVHELSSSHSCSVVQQSTIAR
jgi:hypothetical protein